MKTYAKDFYCHGYTVLLLLNCALFNKALKRVLTPKNNHLEKTKQNNFVFLKSCFLQVQI